MTNKKSFVLYLDYWDQISLLNKDEQGTLLSAIFSYLRGEPLPEMSKITLMAFSIIKNGLDRDCAKWEKRAETSRANGAKGGRPKVNKDDNPENPVGLSENLEEPTKPVNVNVNDTVNGTVTNTPPLPPSVEGGELMLAMEAYNDVARRVGLPVAQRLSSARKKKLRTRLADVGGLDGWHEAMGKLEQSSFCRGENNKGWKADLDFCLQEKSFNRLMEGSYNHETNNSIHAGRGAKSPLLAAYEIALNDQSRRIIPPDAD